MKALLILTLLAFGFATSCMLIAGYIETAALSQPSVANSVFRHPHLIKGVIRFFTDQQESVYSIVRPIMFPAWVIAAVVGGWYSLLVRREAEEIKRKKLDRIFAEDA
jgi:hypothetical protein